MTTVCARNATIRTIVTFPISAFSYRKALIAKILFRQILGYTDCSSISISALVSTATACFDMSTAMAEHEAEAVEISIRDSICCVNNKSCVGFLDSTGTPSLSLTLTTAHAKFLIFLIARLLTLMQLMIEHQIPFISSNFLCAYLTIPPFLSLIFRCLALLLLPINHRCLHSIQLLAVYRMLC